MKKLTYKQFSFLYIYLFLGIFILSFILNSLDFTINENDLIRKYQQQKIIFNDKIDTIFIGDSSCGNAIDHRLVDTKLHIYSLNLALTGSFGIEGNLNILKSSIKKFSQLKNVILIQTLDIWSRDYSYIGVFDTLDNVSSLDENLYKKYIIYKINPKELWWHIKYYLFSFPTYINKKYDYLQQKDDKFSNKKLFIRKENSLPLPFTHNYKQKAFQEYNNICKKHHLNCFFFHGPIHQQIYKQSPKAIYKIQQFIKNSSPYIHSSNKIFSYPSFMIGDEYDHIDPKYKQRTTLDYINEIKKVLK